jgi:DNA repair protein RecO (recombination protein O)
MLVKTKAIVISALRYQEKSLIVKCFTEQAGMKSYFVRNGFSGKTAQRIAYFQPLTMLEIEASHKNTGTLEHFREVRLGHAYTSISSDVVKSTIILFVSEMLHHSIREEETNPGLFAFLETALLWLDSHESVANFHLILLLEATKFLGFYPDLTHAGNSFFEMDEGVFTDYAALGCISLDETALFKRLMGLRFSDDQRIFSVAERQILLRILIDYYALHLPGFKKPKSLEVLRAVFA